MSASSSAPSPANPTAASKNTASPPKAAPGSPNTRNDPMNDPAATNALFQSNLMARSRSSIEIEGIYGTEVLGSFSIASVNRVFRDNPSGLVVDLASQASMS